MDKENQIILVVDDIFRPNRFWVPGGDHQRRNNSLLFLYINSTYVALAESVTIVLPLTIANRAKKMWIG